ncbi:hypothetical protein LV82_00295 [Albidovulum inexpectatum]|uniref:Uncharacterized protein n=1 Tax=Albidovulum inexpectatum TaxID=196587 RepID=A0A2S5JM92_9RHOB|nr:hypothetical protein [Albidovulum inexpectatum]PPB82365.1 hypothetical protein LV82_00295 [Albidovulum inexpectatum]
MTGTMFASLDDFVAKGRAHLARGPVALVFVEDSVEIASTLLHLSRSGFRAIIAFVPAPIALPEAVGSLAIRVTHDTLTPRAWVHTVNTVIDAAPAGTWLHYCFNAEYLFYPFCETRSVGELLTFHAEERRDAMLTYVIDLYARDLSAHPNGVSREEAMLDRTGYYALGRNDPVTGQPLDRQLDFFGGLRWRFEEHIPPARRRISRIALFRAQKGLRLQADHTFNIQEYNTYSCPWHHNLTAAIASFRVAKALRTNPGSRHDIHSFLWSHSVPFEWSSRQLMELGLMEPGQWF